MNRDGQVTRPGELEGVAFQRGGEPEIVEDARPQPARHEPHVCECLRGARVEIAREVARHLHVRRLLETGETEEQTDQRLRGVVVELAGEPPALLLLGRDHLVQELSRGGRRAAALEDPTDLRADRRHDVVKRRIGSRAGRREELEHGPDLTADEHGEGERGAEPARLGLVRGREPRGAAGQRLGLAAHEHSARQALAGRVPLALKRRAEGTEPPVVGQVPHGDRNEVARAATRRYEHVAATGQPVWVQT